MIIGIFSGLLFVLLIGLVSGYFYLQKWAKYFVDAMVKRDNDWYITAGLSLFKVEEEELSAPDFWQTGSVWRLISLDRQTLKARSFTQEGSKWVVCLHSYRSSGYQSMGKMAQRYFQAGYNVLVPDLRGHGESQGEIIGMGWLDRLDLVAWIQEICQKDPQAKIILHGVSMGAATVLMASGEKMPANVELLIADSSYSSVFSEFKELLHTYTKYPVNRFLVLANRYARRQIGYSLIKASVTRQLGSNHLPVLFMQGTKDSLVNPDETKSLAQASAGQSQVVYFEGCGHLRGQVEQTEKYWQTVAEFIKTYQK